VAAAVAQRARSRGPQGGRQQQRTRSPSNAAEQPKTAKKCGLRIEFDHNSDTLKIRVFFPLTVNT
jgi:hypothetical protein